MKTDDLIAYLVSELTARYKIDPDQAKGLVAEMLIKDAAFAKQAEQETSLDKFKKRRTYKEFRTRLRKQAYYSVRKYKSDDQALTSMIEELQNSDRSNRQDILTGLLHQHVSTRERRAEIEQFFDLIFSNLPELNTILDVGCGLFPLSFPFETAGSSVTTYLAADKDSLAVDAVNALAPHLPDKPLIGINWNIDEGWPALLAKSPVKKFDLCLMLQTVPVVARQSRKYLYVLAEAPARHLIVTGARASMTKHESIERREKGLLLKFAKMTGKEILQEFTVGNEVGLILG